MRSATRPLSLPHGSAAKRRYGATRWPPRASSRNSDGRCRAAGAKLIGPVGKRNPHVLIAGAGIGGLTAALALLKLGFDVDLYEQARELKEVGAGLNLSANGNRALHALGVLDDLKPLACDLTGKEVRLWNTGQTWKLFDLGTVSVERYGFPFLAAYRPDLLRVLASAVRHEKADAIHLNSSCTGFTQEDGRVTLKLKGGGEVSGDALIGADGVHSRIRQALFGDDKPEFTGSVEREDWKIESWTTRGTVEECANDYKGWHEDIHLMIRSAPWLFKWALLGRSPMDRWTVGHVSLLGDACHPMLPSLGQGAMMAIEDGFVLARCFEQYSGDGGTALARYEEARRDRTRRVVTGSAENAKRFHNPALASRDGAQAYVDREWSEERIKQRYEWLFTYDVTSVAC